MRRESDHPSPKEGVEDGMGHPSLLFSVRPTKQALRGRPLERPNPVPPALPLEADEAKSMGQRRKRRRLSRPRSHLLAFSSFARSLSRSAACAKRGAVDTSLASETLEAESMNPKSRAAIKRVDESSDDDGEEQEEMVQADFGFFDPKPGDFNGVKLLLQRYLDDRPWDLSGFVDLILEQTTVGTVVKLDGNNEEDEEHDNDEDADEGLYGVITALNLKRYAGHQCMAQLKEYLLEVCSNESMEKEFKSILEERASDVGLLVSQRFVNCPYQLVPPLYDAVFDEVSWATEDEPTQELREFFRFKFYLLLTRIYMNKNVNQRMARPSHNSDEPIIFIKVEDEIFHELSTLSFTFRLHAEQLAPRELKNYREMGLVMVVKADRVPEFRKKLKTLVDEP